MCHISLICAPWQARNVQVSPGSLPAQYLCERDLPRQGRESITMVGLLPGVTTVFGRDRFPSFPLSLELNVVESLLPSGLISQIQSNSSLRSPILFAFSLGSAL